jgi:tRNA threonylcarbamoyladenosine biosynthesis protein TsaB
MNSLRGVLKTHKSALVLDAASTRVQAGLLRDHEDSRWQSVDGEAGVALFRCVEALAPEFSSVGAFIFCDGPGSILGIRTVAMALRTWSLLRVVPTYSYCSLALVAHALGDRTTSIIADARRDTWHEYHIGGELRRVGTGMLASNLAMPEHFRHWMQLPPNVRIVPYDLPRLWPTVADEELLRPTDSPDAFLHEEPSYVTWQPQIHRAPTSP